MGKLRAPRIRLWCRVLATPKNPLRKNVSACDKTSYISLNLLNQKQIKWSKTARTVSYASLGSTSGRAKNPERQIAITYGSYNIINCKSDIRAMSVIKIVIKCNYSLRPKTQYGTYRTYSVLPSNF